MMKLVYVMGALVALGVSAYLIYMTSIHLGMPPKVATYPGARVLSQFENTGDCRSMRLVAQAVPQDILSHYRNGYEGAGWILSDAESDGLSFERLSGGWASISVRVEQDGTYVYIYEQFGTTYDSCRVTEGLQP